MKPLNSNNRGSKNLYLAKQSDYRFYSTAKFACLLMTLFLFLSFIPKSFSQTRVVAYVPTWVNFPGIVNTVDLTKVTHLNIAFANPDGSGALTGVNAGDITTVIDAAHAKNVKVLMSIGGAGASASTYSSLLSNSTSSSDFVAQLVQYAVSNNLDGIDVDIEGDVLDGNNLTADQYQTFVTQLSSGLHAKGKIMTAALATWFGDFVTNAAAAQFDYINIMSYDAAIPGTGNAPGQHSSYQFAVDDFNYWHDTKGVSGANLTVGLPFYGYGWGSYAQPGNKEYAYVDIVSQFPGAENNDQIGSGPNAVYYNGIPTIKKKTEFAIANASGVMIWELTEDATGSKSLLDAISQVIGGNVINQPPTVSLTSPANNASFTAPASLTINATAADADGTISKVEFYNGPAFLGSSTSSPYAFTWNNVAAGSYTLTAKATDNSGAVSQSSAITVVVKSSINNGSGDGLTGNYFNGMNFDTPVYNRVDANINFDWGTGSPNAAVNSDQFSARWTGQIQSRYSETYTFYLNTDNGRRLWINNQLVVDQWIDDWGIEYTGTINLTAGQKYDIRLEYFEDWGGASCKMEWSSASQTKEIVPQSQLYSNPLPSVNISSPSNNANFAAPANVIILANASDNVSVSKVEFYNGTTKLGESTTSPYSYNWTAVGTGSYNLVTKATDNQGGITVSSVVNIMVGTVVIINQPPTVSLTSPSNNTNYNAPANISITAAAADADGTVSKVDFYNENTLLFSDATSPYSYTWTNVTAGIYSITAKATDNSGASTTSTIATVTVKTVSTNSCLGIAQYVENGGYVPESKVQNAGSQYQCKPFPYSGWCNGAAWAYGPGTGAYWSDAWTLVGSCENAARSATDFSTTSTTAISNNPNPFTYSTTVNILVTEAGDVSVLVYDKTGYLVGTVVEGYLSAGTHAFDFDASNLKADLYFIKYHSSNGVVAQKIIKVQ